MLCPYQLKHRELRLLRELFWCLFRSRDKILFSVVAQSKRIESFAEYGEFHLAEKIENRSHCYVFQVQCVERRGEWNIPDEGRHAFTEERMLTVGRELGTHRGLDLLQVRVNPR